MKIGSYIITVIEGTAEVIGLLGRFVTEPASPIFENPAL